MIQSHTDMKWVETKKYIQNYIVYIHTGRSLAYRRLSSCWPHQVEESGSLPTSCGQGRMSKGLRGRAAERYAHESKQNNVRDRPTHQGGMNE